MFPQSVPVQAQRETRAGTLIICGRQIEGKPLVKSTKTKMAMNQRFVYLNHFYRSRQK